MWSQERGGETINRSDQAYKYSSYRCVKLGW